jgi:peptide-methionine (S)-S-oxide reductase
MKSNTQIATFAAGCFWGVQDIFSNIKGILKTTVGYMGGELDSPTYADVRTGTTGHAEVVQLEFDPNQITYDELLGYFFRLHDPTTLNSQGVDFGSQYRSEIFYHDDEQKKLAGIYIAELESKKIFNKKIVTGVSAVSMFYKAEEYHQDYFKKNGGHVCHILRPKLNVK